jgi:hypothetical protein
MAFKRRITPEQLQELTEEQNKKLCDWWTPSEGDVFIVSNTKNTIIQNYIGAFSLDSLRNFAQKPKGYMPLLDIGQMIEFLDEDGFGIEKQKEDFWNIYVFNDTGWKLDFGNIISNDQLCDALWMVVKAVLQWK